jgi:predicted small lipoprotein YifL
MTRFIALLLVALTITACGVKGDPEPPPEQAEQSQ